VQEKYKDNDSEGRSEGSSSDETEDEDGFLLTEEVDARIADTINAIRTKDPRIYDKNYKFFPDPDDEDAAPRERKQKPVNLRDYHRQRLVNGDMGASDDEDDVPRTYEQEQQALKNSILSDINAKINSDASEEEDFIQRKAGQKPAIPVSTKPIAKLTEEDVANAHKDPQGYLDKYMATRAWIPEASPKWEAFESDEDDSEFDAQAEEVEHAFNRRFEDPTKSNEVLRTYARDRAEQKSVRRDEPSRRAKQRQLEKEKKEAGKQKEREERARLKRLKLEEAEEKLRKIKEVAGIRGKNVDGTAWLKILEEEWDNGRWEEEMSAKFGEEYYAEQDKESGEEEVEDDAGTKKKRKVKKPKWDDDIDITDIAPDFDAERTHPAITLSEDEDEEDEEESSRPHKKARTSKERQKERLASRKADKKARAELEDLVEAKMAVDEHLTGPLTLSPSSKQPPQRSTFRYRETSPVSFGLTARDILLAPSDAALNQFAGLKKLATWRDDDKKRRDAKRFKKKHHLRMWRKEVFGPEFEKTGPTYGFERVVGDAEHGSDAAAAGAGTMQGVEPTGPPQKIETVSGAGEGEGEGEKKKKRKRSKKKAVAEAPL
jgi:protein KRI1